MRNVLITLIVIVLLVAILGFYRGWFTVKQHQMEEEPSATFSVDESKIKKDEQKVKEGFQGMMQSGDEETENSTEKASTEKTNQE